MYYAYVRYVEDKKTEIVPQSRVKHLDGEKFCPENDDDFELTKLYQVKWTGENESSGDEEELFYEARVLRISRSESSLKKWVKTNCEERRLAVRKIPFSPEPEKPAGSSRAEKMLAKRGVTAEAQKKRKLSIETARKSAQSEILQMNIAADRRKNHDCTEESKEISRLRRRLQEAERTIENLKEENEECNRQFLRLSRNFADISSINVDLHKMLARNCAAVSSGQINGACVVQPEGKSSNVISISGAALKEKEISKKVLSLPLNDGANVHSISGAALKEKETSKKVLSLPLNDGANVHSISDAALKEKEMLTEVVSLPFNDDDDFVLADPMEEDRENSELIHDVVVDNASKEPEVCSLNDDKTEIYMGHNIWLSMKQWNGVRSNSDDSKFVKDLAFAIYGQKLERKSVTGRKCPRKDDPPKEAMTPSKLAVIRDFYIRKVRKENNIFTLQCKGTDGNFTLDEKKVNRNICQWIGEKSASLAKKKKAV